MRILIDLQGAQSASRHRGIGRSTLAHALAMARNKGTHEVFILLNGMLQESIRPIRDAFAPWLPASHIRVWQAIAPVDASEDANGTRRAIAQLLRDDVIREIQPDVLHVGSLFDGFGDDAVPDIWPRSHSAFVAVTFHDAIPLIHREIYLSPNPVYEQYYLRQAIQLQHADLILSVSASARDEAVQHFGIPNERVVNISSSVDDVFRPVAYTDAQTQSLGKRLKIEKKYILYTGATDERKNHRGLIEAFALLPMELRSAYQLVLGGGLPDEHRQQLDAHIQTRHLGSDDVVITGRISDDDLVQLYNQCALYVFPSWHEGFGLPALEAMACGAPTLGANTTSVPEVIGWDRAMFDPHQPEAIAQKMAEALTDTSFYQALKTHALTQAASFSWDKSAKTAWAAFENLAGASLEVSSGNSTSSQLLPAVAQLLAQPDASVDLFALSQAVASNQQNAQPQLLVDVSELIVKDARTGIQRVVRSILHEWLSNPPAGYEVRAVYATDKKLGYCYADRFVQQFRGQLQDAQDTVIDYGVGDIFIALDMQPQVQVYQAPFYQRMRDNGVAIHFLVHDLLPITMPQYFPDCAAANHAQWLRVAARSDGIVCVSQATAGSLKAWLQTSASAATPRVRHFHLGADIQSSVPSTGRPANSSTTLTQLSARITFLMVGTLEPRKGHEQGLDAVEELWRVGHDINLVIVGKQGWDVEVLAKRLQEHPQRGQRLFWLDGISDEFLDEVYKRADCLIAASFGEGFGLPLIEAAQRQLPIVARDIPVFREVAGEHAHYFDGKQSDALKQALLTWLELNSKGLAPQSKNMPWLTWKQSSENLFEAINLS